MLWFADACCGLLIVVGGCRCALRVAGVVAVVCYVLLSLCVAVAVILLLFVGVVVRALWVDVVAVCCYRLPVAC